MLPLLHAVAAVLYVPPCDSMVFLAHLAEGERQEQANVPCDQVQPARGQDATVSDGQRETPSDFVLSSF